MKRANTDDDIPWYLKDLIPEATEENKNDESLSPPLHQKDNKKIQDNCDDESSNQTVDFYGFQAKTFTGSEDDLMEKLTKGIRDEDKTYDGKPLVSAVSIFVCLIMIQFFRLHKKRIKSCFCKKGRKRYAIGDEKMDNHHVSSSPIPSTTVKDEASLRDQTPPVCNSITEVEDSLISKKSPHHMIAALNFKQRIEIQRDFKTKLKEVDDDLFKSILSTFFGSHFMTCVIIGCCTRLLLSNKGLITRLIINEEDLDPTSIFNWFATNMCGCVEDDTTTDTTSQSGISTSTLSWSSWLVGRSNATSFFIKMISLLFSSSMFANCIFDYTVKIFMIHVIHRSFQLLQFPTNMHNTVNILFFLFTIITTKSGRKLMSLIAYIFVFNALFSCIAYSCYYYNEEVVLTFVLDGGNNTTRIEERLKGMIQEARKHRRRLYTFPTLFAFSLGVLSFWGKI